MRRPPPPPTRPLRRRGRLARLALATALAAAPSAVTAQEAREASPERPPWAPREWAFTAGVFDLTESDALEAGIEARFEPAGLRLFGRDWSIEPALGATANEDGGFYGYFSLRLPFDLGPRWRAVPFTGGGVYSAGDGKDLGGPVEFRSGLELSVRVGERARVGLLYTHLSNAVLYDLNPGAETLGVVVAIRR